MFRKQFAKPSKQQKDRVNWRGHEVTRIEAFSDAVFAFAITLLIVSLEVPKTPDELFESMKSFFPFAICFSFLFQIWVVQNIFFRRYGLHDTYTIALNGILLFVVLFFVYPLKFLFSVAIFGHGASFTSVGQMYDLIYLYCGGFAAIYFLFSLMYYNAWRQRDALKLTPSEAFETVTNIYRNLIMVGVACTSIFLTALHMEGSANNFIWVPFMLIGAFIGLLHAKRGKIHRKKYEQEVAAGENPMPENVLNDDIS